jgi:hypothetical protein
MYYVYITSVIIWVETIAMPMILPEELASKSVIPAIRALIVKRLVEEHDMTQQEAAKLLGVTQPAVSKYLHQKRGAAIRLGGIKEIDQATIEIADMVSTRKAEPAAVMSKIEAACEYVRRNRYMCDLHKRLEPEFDVNSCHVCDQ